MTISVESLLLSRLTPLVALVRERRPVTAQAGGAFSHLLFREFVLIQTTVPRLPKGQPRRMQNEIRKHVRNMRITMSRDERASASKTIAEKVIHSSWFQRSKTIACYLPVPGEVDTWRIIARAWRMKKRIFAPVTEKNGRLTFREIKADTALYANNFGLLEPRNGETTIARKLDVVITPLVAFDSHNHRIGMGGGYFDRTFSFLLHRNTFLHPKLIGVAFACQKVGEISPNPWDIRLFSVLTEAP